MNSFEKIGLYNKPPKVKRFWKKKRDKIKIKAMSEEARTTLRIGERQTSERVKEYAEGHRRHQTRSERMFRTLLNKARISEHFQSQVALFGYILDFYCPPLRLCIEIDGKSHKDQREYDEKRTKVLFANGIKVMRFTNKRVRKDPFGVISEVSQAIGIRKQLRLKNFHRGKVYLAGENTQEQLSKLVQFRPNKWDGPKEPYVPKWLS